MEGRIDDWWQETVAFRFQLMIVGIVFGFEELHLHLLVHAPGSIKLQLVQYGLSIGFMGE